MLTNSYICIRKANFKATLAEQPNTDKNIKLMEFVENLRCPITKNKLELISKAEFDGYLIPSELDVFGELKQGLIDDSKQFFYPIFNDIIILYEHYAIYIGNDFDNRHSLSFDKKRVLDYYNKVNYQVKDSYTKASRHYPPTGKYLLDIASGPIGFPEYIALSEGYEYRICVDISINALMEAKANLENAGQKGIYICGDITNIPMKDQICDTVLCQHTLYHIPRKEQSTAVNEMYRVAKNNSKIVIIYCWFYNSWMMNLTLNFVQIYRVTRHYAGKLYVRFVNSKPKLYFFAHSPRWFKKSFTFGKDIEFYCWRSTNKFFMDTYIHKNLGGKWMLKKLGEIEDKHSKFMSTFGEYAAIVITKKE